MSRTVSNRGPQSVGKRMDSIIRDTGATRASDDMTSIPEKDLYNNPAIEGLATRRYTAARGITTRNMVTTSMTTTDSEGVPPNNNGGGINLKERETVRGARRPFLSY